MGTDNLTVQYDWDILCKSKVLCTAGWWLTFWAGAMNALTSYSVMFMRSTHMTGRMTDQARYVLTNPAMAVFVTLVLASFVGGSYCGTRALPYLGLSYGLLVPALPMLLAAGVVSLGFSASGPSGVEPGRYVLGTLLPFAAGWQNSVTSQGRLGRTTHLSGELTDLGIALATGNRDRAVYLFTKYSGFVAGGMLGYLGGQGAPVLTMVGIAGGYAATVAVFHLKNALAVRPVAYEQAVHLPEWQSLGKEETYYGEVNS